MGLLERSHRRGATPMKTPKRPRDPNQLAHFIVALATGDVPAPGIVEESKKSTRARKAGIVGGRSRSESLAPEVRALIASKAAKARWEK